MSDPLHERAMVRLKIIDLLIGNRALTPIWEPTPLAKAIKLLEQWVTDSKGLGTDREVIANRATSRLETLRILTQTSTLTDQFDPTTVLAQASAIEKVTHDKRGLKKKDETSKSKSGA